MNKRLSHFITFFIFNIISTILSIQFAVGFHKSIDLMSRDSVSYIAYSDMLYNNATGENVKIDVSKIFPFYSWLNYLCYKFFGTSYITLQIFYFVIIFLTNFFFYYLFNAITKHLTSYIQHLLSFPFFNIQLSIYNFQYLLFLFNFVVFSAHSNKFLPENLLMGLTLGSWFLTFYISNEGKFKNWFLYILCAIFYSAVVMTKPQGIAVIAGIILFCIIYKHKKLFLVALPSFFFLLIYLFLKAKYLPGVSGYGAEHIFYNQNFEALFYAIYRLIFTIPYELFFSDAGGRIVYRIDNNLFFSLFIFVKAVISIILWLIVIYGFLKLQRDVTYRRSFSFITYCFVITIIGFLIHTPAEYGYNVVHFYQSRMFMYLWPFFVICFMICYAASVMGRRVFLNFFIFCIIFVNLFLLGKNAYYNIIEINNREPYFDSRIENNYKVLCIGYNENKSKYEMELITYTLFRKYCKTSGNVDDYDYVINFLDDKQIGGFHKIYKGRKWNVDFTISGKNNAVSKH